MIGIPAEVVTEPLKKPNIIAQIVVTLVNYWVWFILIFVGAVILVFIFLLIKSRQKHVDPFADHYKRVKALCKFQKDPTLREIYIVGENKLQHIGHYMGHCVTQDGYQNIMFWKHKKWYLFWIPAKIDFFDLVKEVMIIRCNLNKKFKYIEKKNPANPANPNPAIQEEKEMDLAHDLTMRSGENLMIRAVGLERVKYFLYPVLRNEKGEVVNKSLEIFEREKNPALIDVLYTLSEDFANVSRELVNINPRVRYYVKTGQTPEGGQ